MPVLKFFQHEKLFILIDHDVIKLVLRNIDVGNVLLAAVDEVREYHAVNRLVSNDHNVIGVIRQV